jgi:hypothetical protein
VSNRYAFLYNKLFLYHLFSRELKVFEIQTKSEAERGRGWLSFREGESFLLKKNREIEFFLDD